MKRTLTTALVAATAIAALTACEVEETGSDSSTGSGSSDTGGSSEAKSPYTVAQQNAIKSAKSYLGLGSGFSRAGLIGQLSSKAADGYKRKDAVFAVNHIKVDYNKQAVISAKGYLSMGGMSRDGLIEQLSSRAGSQFTRAQAEYAADKLGL